MAEIRSTLDIIMERTKGLTMSEEERRKTVIEETSARIRGLVQRYLDSILSLEAFEEQFTELQRQRADIAAHALRDACLEKLDLDQDSRPLLHLLERFRLCDAKALRDNMASILSELQEKKLQRSLKIIRELEQEGIKGSALVPNLEVDEVWNTAKEEARRSFRKGLRDLYCV